MPKTSTSGQGRPKGVPNKASADIKALAQSFGPAAINKLARMSGLLTDASGEPIPGAESEATQAAAIKELLDRGYGKARQPLTGAEDDSNPVIEVVYRWADSDSK